MALPFCCIFVPVIVTPQSHLRVNIRWKHYIRHGGRIVREKVGTPSCTRDFEIYIPDPTFQVEVNKLSSLPFSPSRVCLTPLIEKDNFHNFVWVLTKKFTFVRLNRTGPLLSRYLKGGDR
jgi:hypothetical protein